MPFAKRSFQADSVARDPLQSSTCAALARVLEPGERVVIYTGVSIVTMPMVEGFATIVASIDPELNLYRVRFTHEPGARVRFVHPPLQGDHVGVLKALLLEYRAALDPSLRLQFPPFRG